MFESQEAMEAEVARLVGLLNVTTARLVAVVAEAVATGSWEQAGVRSPAHWLAWKAGMSPRRARRLVALARRQDELPTTTAAFAAGSLAEDQATEIATHVPAAHDAELAALAQVTTVTQLQKVARSYAYSAPPTDQDEPEPEPPPPPAADDEERDEVRFGFTEDGRWELRVDVGAELGALAQRALEACRSAVFHERHPEATDGAPVTDTTWVEGFRRVAETSLIGLLGDRRPGDTHQVIIHVRADHEDRPTWLHLGPALPAAVRRQVSCDAVVRYLVEDARGVPIKLGRKQHTIPPHLRTVVEDRDRQCRGPGCSQARWLQAHHVVHWEDGGGTDPENLVLLCGAHHRLHHQGLLSITGDASRPDGLVFTNRWGKVVPAGAVPEPPEPGVPLEDTARGLGLPPPDWTHPSGERLDPWWITFRDPPAAA